MTDLQKFIIEKLIDGYHIVNCRTSGYRLRDEKTNPVRRFSEHTFQQINKYVRKKGHIYVINRKIIREQSGKTWVKKYYKEQYLIQKTTTECYT
jgi:hypothetical protein